MIGVGGKEGAFALALTGSKCLGGAERQRKSQTGICSLAGSEVAGAHGKNPAHGMQTWDVADLGTARAACDHRWGEDGIQQTEIWAVPTPLGNLVAVLSPDLSSCLCLPYLTGCRALGEQ